MIEKKNKTVKQTSLLSKTKGFGTICLGIFLFSAILGLSMFPNPEESESSINPFINVKEGKFAFLDNKGYNFEFVCEINQVLITETRQIIGKDQILIESNNSFGITQFLFDRQPSGNVKFTIDHQGNLRRDYWFRMVVLNTDKYRLFKYRPVLVWESGYFDFVDMMTEETFDITKAKNDFKLSLRFPRSRDFFIDPILSAEAVLDSVNVTTYDEYRVNGLKNVNSLFWDTTNITGWTQFVTSPENKFGMFSNSQLKNGDFDQFFDQCLFDPSLDDDIAGWYSNKIESGYHGNTGLSDRASAQNTSNWWYDLNTSSNNEQPFAHYRFNEGLGSTMIDSAGFRNGTYYNGVNFSPSVSSELNYSLDIDSDYQTNNEYARVNDHDAFSFGNGTHDFPFSFEFWVKFHVLRTIEINTIVQKSYIYNWYSEYFLYLPVNSNSMRMKLFDQSAQRSIWRNCATSFVTDTWYHVVVTYGGHGTGSIHFYINGTLSDGTTGRDSTFGRYYTAMENLAGQVYFGREAVYEGSDFDGQLDEFCFYNYSLTQEAVTYRFNNGAARLDNWQLNSPNDNLDDNLVLYYKFDEHGTTDQIIDSSPKSLFNTTMDGYDNIAIRTDSFNVQANDSLDWRAGVGWDRIILPDHDNLTFTDGAGDDLPFTIMFWMNNSGGNTQGIFSKFYGGLMEYTLKIEAHDMTMRLWDESTNGARGIRTTRIIPRREWAHYAITFDGGGWTGIKMYINGVQVSTSYWGYGSYDGMDNTSARVHVGYEFWTMTDLTSELDEFRVWKNRELTAEEVYQDFVSSKQGFFQQNCHFNRDGGDKGENRRWVKLDPYEQIYQDVWIDSDVVSSINIDTRLAGLYGSPEGLEVRVDYSDATYDIGTITNFNDTFWHNYLLSSQDTFTTITAGKIITKISLRSINTFVPLYIDNVRINYSNSNYLTKDNTVWTPIGLFDWAYKGYSTDRSTFFHHERNSSSDIESGIFINNPNIGLNFTNTWQLEINLTFNPNSSYYDDYSFAGGMQFHFLNSSYNSLAYVNLIDNSTAIGEDNLGGSLFYNTSSSGGTYAQPLEFDPVNINISNQYLKIKKEGSYIYVWYPETTSFGGQWLRMEQVETIFQTGLPVAMGVKFIREKDSRPLNYPARNDSHRDFYSNGNDFAENFTTISSPKKSRYFINSPMAIASWNFTYGELNIVNKTDRLIAENTGYLLNGSSQVKYKINYTIPEPNGSTKWVYHNHSFVIPKTYSFLNVTFGNGVSKTLPDGFEILSMNSSHNLIKYETTINGTFTWYFLTANAIVHLSINPDMTNGTLANQTLVEYNIRVANGSLGINNYRLKIQIKHTDETVIFEEIQYTNPNGWLNSSLDRQLEMKHDHKFWFVVTGVNESFLGYAVDSYLSYNDFDPPVITKIEFDEVTDPSFPKDFYLWVSDIWTRAQDISVVMYYGYVSSGSLTEYAFGSFQEGKHEISVAGKPDETTIWFKFVVTDNMSNTFESSVYSALWREPPPDDRGSGDDNGGGNGVTPTPSGSGGLNELWIFVFLIGALFSAILIVGIYRRVTVRTRRIEEREVISVFGRTGRAKERIVEKQ